MGNTALGKAAADGGGATMATLQASLARHRSSRSNSRTHSTRSTRSMRRVSVLSTRSVRERDSDSFKQLAEKLPPNIADFFEIAPVELKMQRNLCGCTHSLARVDVVVVAPSGSVMAGTARASLVDRRISGLHAEDAAAAVRLVHHELQVHSYLAHEWIVAHGDGGRSDQAQHPHLVALQGQFIQQDTLHVLTEFYPLGNLLTVLHPELAGPLKSLGLFQSDVGIRQAARQVCAAVAYLHGQGIAHMDVALENLFVDAKGALHLGDFRHAVVVNKPRGMSDDGGEGSGRRKLFPPPPPIRREYAAPELYTGREVDLFKADAWSLGVVIVMLLTKQQPFDEATTANGHYRLLQVLGVAGFLDRMKSENEQLTKQKVTPIISDFVELLTELLICEPDKRCSVVEALEKYPWLKMNDPVAVLVPTPAIESSHPSHPHHQRF